MAGKSILPAASLSDITAQAVNKCGGQIMNNTSTAAISAQKYNDAAAQPLADTSYATQRSFILQCLREQPHSTLELRALGICSPASRINELRNQGYVIETTRRHEYDSAGVLHSIAVYTLLANANRQRRD
ncbi:helix-turn-helix domain-containing protein [Snodgrassella gandavensis]|uniref:helix-turn-helix domain-containing protein n=1 Tax=Snodgrassella gandavensis TaxID=2946698 RepID=UPI001EF5E8D7|nr:helix-turn-helix domain-containing protein [Snodgrassella gandavensis]